VLYKAAQSSPTIFPHRFVTIISLNALELFLFFSAFYYVSGLSTFILDFDNIGIKIIGYSILAIPLVINYFVFDYKDKYKDYVKEFDKLPKKNNAYYKKCVWAGIVLIIVNLIYSFYYMDQQAQKKHEGRYSNEYMEYEKQQIKEDSISRANRSH
jgi:hypothetical protein